MDYQEFLQQKTLLNHATGKVIDSSLVNPVLKPHQIDCVIWGVRKGRCAFFLDTGLGKTLAQLEWARLIMDKRALIIAPLAVAKQTVSEAKKWLNLNVYYSRDGSDLINGINITNFEMIEHFKPDDFDTIVIDESSVLKSLNSKTRVMLTEMFAKTPYKLCCTATPAPNDIKEIGYHAEFLGAMTQREMLSCFFRYSQAGGHEKKEAWRLKKHAISAFYKWLASWSLAIKLPSDMGHSDEGYILPPLNIHHHFTKSNYSPDGMLPGFGAGAISAIEAKRLRHVVMNDRIAAISDMVNNQPGQWTIWTALNDEADTLHDLIPGSINVEGKLSPDKKADLILEFQRGEHRVLITKGSIAGFGVNLQNCSQVVKCGIDYSWESYYQEIRRFWRFGQQNEVNVHIFIDEQEEAILQAIKRKEREATDMTRELIAAMRSYTMEELRNLYHEDWKYHEETATGNGWRLMLGDSCKRMAEIPDNSIDISVYSPPFSDLFVYSATPHDLGNSASKEEFFAHYSYVIRENLRITRPGRMCFVHVTDLRSYLNTDNYIGLKDFSGDVIEAYQREGWVFQHRITVQKNPQTQAVRLKDHRLLFITLEKNSLRLTGGQPDYVLMFSKPGESEVPVKPIENENLSVDEWQQLWIKWAAPVWTDIRETDVLPVQHAKGEDDEKHMCALQLPVIERCLRLWSNPGETLFSPFAGVGSEGYVALQWGRKFIGCELKPEYWRAACHNLENAEKLSGDDLFTWASKQENDLLPTSGD